MFIIDFILHIDEHIYNIANAVGGWTYLILFLVIFIETAAVVFPFLPEIAYFLRQGPYQPIQKCILTSYFLYSYFSLGLLWAIPVIFLLVELWDIVLYIISFLVS